MKKINALSLMLVLSFGMAGSALAAKNPATVDTPRNALGAEAHPLNAGFLHKRDSSTSEMLVCSGRCLLAALVLNTGPRSSQVWIRNTSVEAGNGALVIKHTFETLNTEPGNNPIRFPILLDKGITVQLTGASAGEEVEVLYRDLD